MKNSPYPDPRIVMRKPRQRYDRSLLPMCTMDDQGNVLDDHNETIGTGVVCGTFQGVDGFGKKTTYDAIQVTLKDGTVVPAYRRHSDLQGNNWSVCQRFGYKAAFPKNHVHPATGGTHG